MKHDIVAAYYPLCMSSADMLRAGRLPLWAAQFQFGSPVYASMGVPFWYFSTMLLELLFSYSYRCMAVEYCLHLAIACQGAYLLTAYEMDRSKRNTSHWIPVLCGFAYGYSGLFISNAQHIMIIISAAWLPWVLYFVRKYMDTRRMSDLLTCGITMGMSILGGYPELWVATYIILIPWIAYYTDRTDSFFSVSRVFFGIKHYLAICLSSVCAAAISFIPFFVMSEHISRLNDGASFVYSYPPRAFLSMLLAHYTVFSREVGEPIDRSMVSAYVSILVVFLVIYSLRRSYHGKLFFLGMSAFSVCMMLGSNFIVHPVFRRFFPLFRSLRFPSTWRCVLAVFMIMMAAHVLEEIFEEEKDSRFFGLLLLAGIFFSGVVLVYITIREDYLSSSLVFRKDLVALMLFLSVYLFFFFTKKLRKPWILTCLLVIEMFSFQQWSNYKETVASRSQWDIQKLREFSYIMNDSLSADANRTHEIDYKNAIRTRSDLDSIAIMLGHTLDEQGYLSVKLDYVTAYQQSPRCLANADAPVAFWTNDIVTPDQENLVTWLEKTAGAPYAIYLEVPPDEGGISRTDNVSDATDSVIDNGVVINQLISGDVELSVNKNIAGVVCLQQAYYPGWRVTVDGAERDLLRINGALQGVFVEAGPHTLQFRFRPTDFYVGAVISLLYWMVWCVVCLQSMRRHRRT